MLVTRWTEPPIVHGKYWSIQGFVMTAFTIDDGLLTMDRFDQIHLVRLYKLEALVSRIIQTHYPSALSQKIMRLY